MAKPNRKIKPWRAPEPELRNSHDVRKLEFCQFCKTAGMGLLNWCEKPAHAYCIGTEVSTAALLNLPSKELEKVTVGEMDALGILRVFMKNLDEVRERETTTHPALLRLRQAATNWADNLKSEPIDDHDIESQHLDTALREAATAYAAAIGMRFKKCEHARPAAPAAPETGGTKT